MTVNPKKHRTAIATAWEAGLRRIPMFWLSGMVHIGPAPRLASGVRPRMRWGAVLACVALVSFWTIAVPFTLGWIVEPLALTGPPPASGLVGLGVTSVGSFLVASAAGIGWAGAARHLDRADTFLRRDLRLEVATWLRRLYLLQSTGWAAAALIVVAVFVLVPEAQPFFPTNLGGWLSLGQFVVICGTVGFFAATLPGITTKVTYADPAQVRTFRLDPAATPAVRLCVELISGGGLLLLAVLLIQTTGWYFIQSTSNPPPTVGMALGFGVALVLVGILRTTVIPTIQLHTWIVRLKLQLLSELDAVIRRVEVEHLTGGGTPEGTSSRRASVVDEFFHVSSTENGPFKSSSVVQFGATVFGAAIAYAFVWIFGDPSAGE